MPHHKLSALVALVAIASVPAGAAAHAHPAATGSPATAAGVTVIVDEPRAAPALWLPSSSDAVVSENGLTLEQAVALVRERTGGKVLRADARERGDRRVYRIRVLQPDGRVRTVHVDARTGRID